MLRIMRGALSRGDIGKVSEAMAELLDRFHLNVDCNSIVYRKLGLAGLRAEVRVLEALERRWQNPARAFAGWKKQRERSSGTVTEWERAIELFIQPTAICRWRISRETSDARSVKPFKMALGQGPEKWRR